MIAAVVVDSWVEQRPPADLFDRLPARPGRFILESQGGTSEIARYSFLGHQPFMRLESRGRQIQLNSNEHTRAWVGDPLEALQAQLESFPVEADPGQPPFVGGAVGYLSYDLGRQIEQLPDTARDDLGLPELRLDFYDHLAAYDHVTGRVTIVALPLPGRAGQAVTAAWELASIIRTSEKPAEAVSIAPQPLTSNFTPAAYQAAVERALGYIRRGHIYQVNLSQRFSAPLALAPKAVYDRLRLQNPAPFAAFLHYADAQIISASPERFLRLDTTAGTIETRPIKGTRPRGATTGDDERLRDELLASAKDQAELVMIVDLERNDLGRVCEYGSIRVQDPRRIEAYPTVWHTVATVEGKLKAGLGAGGILRATFPGGSITGAPKIRAMQIIEELEGLRRHVYCGAIGYWGFNGQSDLNIAIRTITIQNNRAYFHAGGGVVADSDPAAEYDETLHKARALARALNADVDQL